MFKSVRWRSKKNNVRVVFRLHFHATQEITDNWNLSSRRSEMSRFHVGGKVVDSVDFLRKRHWAWRLDLCPFAIMYGAWLATIVPSLDAVGAFIVLGSLVALHILVFLFTVWSVDFKCFVQYSKIHAKLLQLTSRALRKLCPFTFGRFEYPQLTFSKLMKEQIMEPFFVFQVFCVGLWCLDEYWYYSLFTLFMLFMFESTMAKSRLKTLTELRHVKVDSQTLMVYLCGKWVKMSGAELLPGDVVSIGRSTDQSGENKSVPADMLILAGSAIVN